MKNLFTLIALCGILQLQGFAQQKIENIIIITSDGLRWQEVFKGLDNEIAQSKKYNQGSEDYIKKTFGGETPEESRKKIFPFLWQLFPQSGQLYGNRSAGCIVENANPYWFSYPGYNEFLTGFPDKKVNSNEYANNPNESVLTFLNKQSALKNKVAAFGAWGAFNRILNEPACGFPVIAAFDKTGGSKPTATEALINKMNAESYKPFGDAECLDVFTHEAAMEHLRKHKPSVLYIGYGETDEWAHHAQYKSYLEAAHQVDQWIKEIWTYVQSQPKYKNKTAMLITVDHGRGESDNWTSHGRSIRGANQTWFGVIAPNINVKGEVKEAMTLYQEQLAQTIAHLLGYEFKSDHPIANRVEQIWK